jgi:catechol 2,3-dioxygenase-like lactoylglutathione lyase family enzyme
MAALVIGTAKVMAFVATKDPARARTFYERTLGLRLVADESFALVFVANGTMLRVQKVAEVAVAKYTALGWEVPDIRTAIEGLAARGVSMEQFELEFFTQDEAGIWTAPDGTKVAWFTDPDGNILSLTQF